MTKTPFTVNHKNTCGKTSPFICKGQLKSPSEGTALRDIALNHLFGCFMSFSEHPTGACRQSKKSKGNHIHCYSKHFSLFQSPPAPSYFLVRPIRFCQHWHFTTHQAPAGSRKGVLLESLVDKKLQFCSWSLG